MLVNCTDQLLDQGGNQTDFFRSLPTEQMWNRLHSLVAVMRQNQGLLTNRSPHFFNIEVARVVLLAQTHGGIVITLVHAVTLLGNMEQATQSGFQQTALVQQTIQPMHLLTHKGQVLRRAARMRTSWRGLTRCVTGQSHHQRRSVNRVKPDLIDAVAPVAVIVQHPLHRIGKVFLRFQKRVVWLYGLTLFLDALGPLMCQGRPRVGAGPGLVGQTHGMQGFQQRGGIRRGQGFYPRLQGAFVKSQVDFRHACSRGKTAIRLGVGLHNLGNFSQIALAHRHQIGVVQQGVIIRRVLNRGPINPCRQQINLVNRAGELAVFFTAHTAGHKNAQMPDTIVRGKDDGLVVTAHIIIVQVQVRNPAQSLCRRGDVVTKRAEHHNGRADIAQINPNPVRGQ